MISRKHINPDIGTYTHKMNRDNKKPIKFAAGYRAFYGKEYLFYSISTVYKHVEKIIIAITDKPQSFSMFKRYKPDVTEEFLRMYPDPENKITIIRGSWAPGLFSRDTRKHEARHSNAVLNYIKEKNPDIDYLIFLDTDEILTDESILGLKQAVENNPHAYVFKMKYRTYWKGLHYITEGETPPATVCVRAAQDVRFTHVREINKPDCVILKDSLFYHHMSYALSTEMLLIKLKTFGHAKEIRKNWVNEVWRQWDKNRNLENLHPLFDGAWWKRAIKLKKEQTPALLHHHPYFSYDTADEYEASKKIKNEHDLKNIFISEMIKGINAL